jgi:hypothetical protein
LQLAAAAGVAPAAAWRAGPFGSETNEKRRNVQEISNLCLEHYQNVPESLKFLPPSPLAVIMAEPECQCGEVPTAAGIATAAGNACCPQQQAISATATGANGFY